MAACPHCYAKITEPPSMLRGDLAYCVECGKYIPRKQLLDNNYVPPPINPAPWGRVERCVLLVNGDEQIARVRFNPLWSRLGFLLIAIVWCGLVVVFALPLTQSRGWSLLLLLSPLLAVGSVPLCISLMGPPPRAEIGRRGEDGWVAWGVGPFGRRTSFKAHSVEGIRLDLRRDLADTDSSPYVVVEVVLNLSSLQLGCRLRGDELHWMVHAARQMFECGDGERRERNAAPCAEL
jgi:hypothetical protein